MALKVMMVPSWENIKSHAPSGIWTVVRAYDRHMHDYDIELVSPKTDSFDVLAIHAGMSGAFPVDAPLVSILHGIYFSSDYPGSHWQDKANQSVVASIRYASAVTVPSEWVAMFLRRDMHLDPYIVGHGVDWKAWQHQEQNEGYIVAYGKNRAAADACDPTLAGQLARAFPDERFLGTFPPLDGKPNNYAVTNLLPQDQWKTVVQRSALYVSTTRETFCLGALEAQAAGVPVLGWDDGGIREFVQHGVTGYLAQLNNFGDLCNGLNYCLQHHDILGENARELAREWTWERATRDMANVFSLTYEGYRSIHDRPFSYAPEVHVAQ